MEITIEQVVKINKRFGGSPLNLSNIEFDLDMANKQKSIYRRSAYIIRGIVVGHPFNDGNKRTALYLVSKIMINKRCNMVRMTIGITNIAKEGISDINKIESRIRQWCMKN